MGVAHVEALVVRGLTFTYPDASRRALTDVSFRIPEGSVTVIVGPNASGKSTLLKHLKREIAPHGEKSGDILMASIPQDEWDLEASARSVGFVMQDPNAQLVTDTVYHEMAFALENLGVEPHLIRRRVAEVATFFGITSWVRSRTSALSEGQKQIVNLAAIIALGPRIILLDEPTAQLDPIATDDFVQILRKVNRELGITIVMATHELDAFAPDVDHVVALESGRVSMTGDIQEYLSHVMEGRGKEGFPVPMTARLARETGVMSAPYPLTVREARGVMGDSARKEMAPTEGSDNSRQHALRVDDVWFRYGKREPIVLEGADLTVTAGSVHALLGSNGSGKSTLLKLLVGVEDPVIGRITRAAGKRTGLLVQDPRSLFRRETIAEEWGELGRAGSEVVERFSVDHLAQRHPYDLSGGEQQLVALTMLMDREPDIVLLDEPSKGLDARAKERLADYLADLASRGKTILYTTHDLEFAATTAHECSLMFDGSIVATLPAGGFFRENLFYTTVRSRIERGHE